MFILFCKNILILSFSTGVEGRVKEATGLSKKKLEVLHVITNILSNDYEIFIPQILRGASNSSKMGWLRNISRDFKHKPLISDSVNCTFLPGLEPRTVEIRKKKLHILLQLSKQIFKPRSIQFTFQNLNISSNCHSITNLN